MSNAPEKKVVSPNITKKHLQHWRVEGTKATLRQCKIRGGRRWLSKRGKMELHPGGEGGGVWAPRFPGTSGNIQGDDLWLGQKPEKKKRDGLVGKKIHAKNYNPKAR